MSSSWKLAVKCVTPDVLSSKQDRRDNVADMVWVGITAGRTYVGECKSAIISRCKDMRK